MFLDTLKELFEGNRALFTGLHADTHWDWTQRHPVIRVSFGSGAWQNPAELELRLREMLLEHAQRLGVSLTHTSLIGRFSQLIELAQLQARGYAEKYRARGEPTHLIGVEFRRAARNVVGFEVMRL